MKAIAGIIAVVIVVAVILIGSSAFVVTEFEQVVITQFGEPIGEVITEAGLYWKKPFVQEVNRFDKRLLSFDGDPEPLPTLDQKYIRIDTYARWRISDPLKFFQRVKDESGAQKFLDDNIDAETRIGISRHLLIEEVRNSDRKLETTEPDLRASVGGDAAVIPGAPEAARLPESVFARAVDRLPSVEKGRLQIVGDIFEGARKAVESGSYGIELIDVQIKGINYTDKVRQEVYNRMISERQQIAEKYRSEGEQFRLGFSGEIERERERLLSEAYAKAEIIKAEGDAEAARIYAAAYNQDPEFYQFWRTLEFYREHLGPNATVVLGTDSDIFRYLVEADIGVSRTAAEE